MAVPAGRTNRLRVAPEVLLEVTIRRAVARSSAWRSVRSAWSPPVVPKTPIGKLQRRTCRAPFSRRNARHDRDLFLGSPGSRVG
jgi:acyl-CoA synthetase (AMP-forming)/AMP-acid ligase II